VVDFQGVIMDRDELMRFALGFLIGACLWVVGNRAHATTIAATPSTQTQAATPQKVCWWNNGFPVTNSTGADTSACATSAAASVPQFHKTCSDPQGTVNYSFVGVGNTATSASISRIVGTFTGPAGGGRSCTTTDSTNFATTYNVTNSTTAYSCPAGWTLSGTNCTQTTYSCPSGYTLSGTNCNSNPPPTGTRFGMMSIPATASPGAGGCVDGILYYFDEASNQFAVNGQQVWYGPASSSGQFCTGQAQAGTGAPNTTCGPGQVPGTINGQTVCLGAGESNPVQKVETATTTTTNAQGQPTGTTTTTTTTKDNGTSPTVTTTTKNPDGTTTTTTQNAGPDTKKPDVQRFCEQNPDLSICKKSTWGGSCGAFACDGDAVQCAIAREIHTRDCALYDTPTTLSTLGNQVSSGADPQASQNPALQANRTTTSLTGSISQDTFLAPGGLADQNIVVSPRLTVKLPWSQLNSYLSIMGGIVVAFALIFAARIVVGAK
jgi:hypothetical protein